MRREVLRTAAEQGWRLGRTTPDSDVFVKQGRQVTAQYDAGKRLNNVTFTPPDRVHPTRRLGHKDKNKLPTVIEWLEGREA